MPSPQKTLINIFIAGWVLISVLTACKHNHPVSEKAHLNDNYSEQLINVNKAMVRTEDELIDDFTGRYGWNMNKTGTGLRYMIYFRGQGPAALPGMKATITCSVLLLNGDTCYPSLTRSFVIGKENVEPGVDEGIRYMHAGDKAKFILPSHLAFGLLGDRKSIPQKATLVYDIHLIDLVNIK
jgi:FKBP-type peptidyl-prolyl cis-trans isomerase